MIVVLYFLFLLINKCVGVMYHLSDSEYYRMPALFALDDYQSCVSDTIGVYCLARFDLHSDQPSELITLIKEYSEYQIKHYNHSHVERGICVTKTCRKFFKDKVIRKGVDLRDTLEKCFSKSLWEDYELKAKLSLLYHCDTYGEEEQIDLSDKIFMSTIIFILILNIAGSCYDNYVKKTGRNLHGLGHTVLSCFSLRQNWKMLTTYKPENPKIERLKGLHGMRTIIIHLTLLMHSLSTITAFIDNPHEIEMSYEKSFYSIMYNGLVIMEIVFTMSGFLLSYNLQLLSQKYEITWNSFPKIFFLRLCRLVPAYGIVLFFTSTCYKHLGSGPLWKLYGRGIADDCRKRWWHHLLFINNYTIMKNSKCLVQTWHIAAEMQLYILGLAVHIATRNCGRRILLTCMLLLGIVLPALHVLLQDLDPLVILSPELYRERQSDTFFMMHILGHNNLAGHVVGMITGYLIYYMQENGKTIQNTFRMGFPAAVFLTDFGFVWQSILLMSFRQVILRLVPSGFATYTDPSLVQHTLVVYYRNIFFDIFSILIWCMLPATIYVFLLGNIFYIEGYEVSFAFKLLYAATQRVLAGAIGATIIISLVFKLNNTLCSILEWSGWVIPSRLTYAIFLVHMNISFVIMGTKTQLGHNSIFFVLMNYFTMAAMSYLIGLPFYLTVEAPIYQMAKTIIDKKDNQYSKMKNKINKD